MVFCLFLRKILENKKIGLLLLSIFISYFTYSQSYPVITKLESKNIIFKQYQEDVENSNRLIAGRKPVHINFYTYKAQKDDNLIKVAARCGITYETISTCNGISESEENIEDKILILSTVTGIFIPEKPLNIMELLLSKQYMPCIEESDVPVYSINGRNFYFLQNQRFDMSDRAFFLDSSMRLPLEDSVLTSSYGMRISPISGQWKMHHGIDMAAPKGTPVYSCKSGIVTTVKMNDNVYGNYVIVSHKNNMTSFYAHLSEIDVHENQNITSGYLLGKVGQTGLATGPHLHFEIRIKGNSTDPSNFF